MTVNDLWKVTNEIMSKSPFDINLNEYEVLINPRMATEKYPEALLLLKVENGSVKTVSSNVFDGRCIENTIVYHEYNALCGNDLVEAINHITLRTGIGFDTLLRYIENSAKKNQK